MIEVNHLVKRVGDKTILKDISFSIDAGECVAIIGPNGAGKSTLMGCMIGDHLITEGTVTINDVEPEKIFHQQMIASLPQENAVPEKIRVSEIIQFFRSIYSTPLTLEEIDELLGFSSDQKHQFAHKLSGGQKRLLSFVLNLIGNPKILILDEPTTGMDTSTRLRFWNVIARLKDKGCTIVYSSHFIEEVEHTADRILVLHHGNLLRDTTPFRMRLEEQEKFFTIPNTFENQVRTSPFDVHSIDVKGDNLHFVTRQPNEMWELLQREGCQISDIEMTNKTLLNTIFDTTERLDKVGGRN